MLHVTERRVFSSDTGVTMMTLLAVMPVVLIVQVAAEAFVAQENAPTLDEPQATIEGEAAEPTAAQIEL